MRCARWQAKHARLAFFLLGRKGSFALLLVVDFVLLLLLDVDLPSVERPSVRSSAMVPESSSELESGDSDGSLASGSILIYLMVSQPILPGVARPKRDTGHRCNRPTLLKHRCVNDALIKQHRQTGKQCRPATEYLRHPRMASVDDK